MIRLQLKASEINHNLTLKEIMAQKKFTYFCMYLFCFYAPNNLNPSSAGKSSLTITDYIRKNNHSTPFVHPTLGYVSWNNTHIALLSALKITTESDEFQPRILLVHNSGDFYIDAYKTLPNWNNANVNAYLIPWPEKLDSPKSNITTSVEPIEGNKKSFIGSTNFSRWGLNESLRLLLKNRNGHTNGHGYQGKKQIFQDQFQDQEADIFFNNRYMIICYNKEGFEITNIAELNGFPLDINQRENLYKSKFYLWEYKNKPIKIETQQFSYSNLYQIELNIPEQTITDSNKEPNKIIEPEKPSFFQKSFSYKWFLLCTVGILGILIAVKKLLNQNNLN